VDRRFEQPTSSEAHETEAPRLVERDGQTGASKTRRRLGRPPRLYCGKTIEAEDLIERLASIHCTREEAAHVLGLSERRLRDRVNAEPELRRRWTQGRLKGRASLRRLLCWHAERPDGSGVRATIFLFAGISRDSHVENNAAGGNTDVFSLAHADVARILTDQELEIWKRLSVRLAKHGSQQS
jgi:hypothetical protein